MDDFFPFLKSVGFWILRVMCTTASQHDQAYDRPGGDVSAQTAWHMLQDQTLCTYKRPFDWIMSHQQQTPKSGMSTFQPCSFITVSSKIHSFSRPDLPTRPHHMNFSPTTIINVIKTCTQKYALTQLLNTLWYAMEAGAPAGEKLLWETAFQLETLTLPKDVYRAPDLLSFWNLPQSNFTATNPRAPKQTQDANWSDK